METISDDKAYFTKMLIITLILGLSTTPMFPSWANVMAPVQEGAWQNQPAISPGSVQSTTPTASTTSSLVPSSPLTAIASQQNESMTNQNQITMLAIEAENAHEWRRRGDALWHTNSNHDLDFQINFQNTGTQQLKVVAGNIGTLPPLNQYSHFEVEVLLDGQHVDTMMIVASGTEWQTGEINFDVVNEGNHTLTLRWKNDYWVPNMYDANILIRQISIEPFSGQSAVPRVPANGDVLDILAHDAENPSLNGWRLYDGNLWHTNSKRNLDFQIHFEASGQHQLEVTAKNLGSLPEPSLYSHFDVEVLIDGQVTGTMTIEASDTEWGVGLLDIEVLNPGAQTLSLRWLNDFWVPNAYDANIMIQGLKLNRVVEESNPEGQSEFMLMDFDDGVLRDDDWAVAQPGGETIFWVKPKGDSFHTPDAIGDDLSIAVGEGVDGGNALLVSSARSESQYNPGFWIVNGTATGGSYDNPYGYDSYLLPRGMKANRLEFDIKFPDGFMENLAAGDYHQNLHIGTYNMDPAVGGRNVESNNWHFYHQVWLRHDEANGDWMHVVVNEVPQHQRSLNSYVNNNPTGQHGNYFETMTRLYIEVYSYATDAEVPRDDVKMWIDNIKFSYVPEPEDITVEILNDNGPLMNGQRITINNDTDGNNNPTEFQLRLTNTTSDPVTGKLTPTAPYWMRQTIVDTNGDPVPEDITLAPGEARTYRILVEPYDDSSILNREYAVGASFTPSDQFLGDETYRYENHTDPKIEKRWNHKQGGHDAISYGAHVYNLVSTSTANDRPSAQGGLTYYVNEGGSFTTQIQASDPDGDTIVYRLVPPAKAGGAGAGYIVNAMGSSMTGPGGTVVLDVNTGQFTFTPDGTLAVGEYFPVQYEVQDSAGNVSGERVSWIQITDPNA